MKQLEVEISRANNFQKLDGVCFRSTRVETMHGASSLAISRVYSMSRPNLYRTLLGAMQLQSAKPK